MKHEYYEGLDLIQTTIKEIEDVNRVYNFAVLSKMKDKLALKHKEIQEKMNRGVQDVVYKFEDNLYAWVLKTIKLKLENYE